VIHDHVTNVCLLFLVSVWFVIQLRHAIATEPSRRRFSPQKRGRHFCRREAPWRAKPVSHRIKKQPTALPAHSLTFLCEKRPLGRSSRLAAAPPTPPQGAMPPPQGARPARSQGAAPPHAQGQAAARPRAAAAPISSLASPLPSSPSRCRSQ
jgi:hypothetical protein